MLDLRQWLVLVACRSRDHAALDVLVAVCRYSTVSPWLYSPGIIRLVLITSSLEPDDKVKPPSHIGDIPPRQSGPHLHDLQRGHHHQTRVLV